MESNSYVYCHRNAITNKIFYIGIGSDKKYERAYSKNNRNRIWNNYIKKHKEYIVEVLYKNITRREACDIETKMIKQSGRIIDKTGPLTNISFGGERTFYGMIRTREHSLKISKAQIGKRLSDETKQKISKANKGLKRKEIDAIRLRTMAVGRKLSDATKEKLRILHLGKKKGKQNKEHIEKRFSARLLKSPNGINAKFVLCINNNAVYNSMKEAAKKLGISDKHIGSVCKGKRTHTLGYKFKYA